MSNEDVFMPSLAMSKNTEITQRQMTCMTINGLASIIN